eukprot:scaffold54634_cov23-Cyclotella_meneghiniana.AAC.1
MTKVACLAGKDKDMVPMLDMHCCFLMSFDDGLIQCRTCEQHIWEFLSSVLEVQPRLDDRA